MFQFQVDQCLSFPCRNNGTCKNDIGGFKCQCPDGFDGNTCDIDINECLSEPCLNDAKCIDVVDGYICM